MFAVILPAFLAAALANPTHGSSVARPEVNAAKKEVSMPMTLSSPAFAAGAPIPVRHTCDGEDRSPELRFADPPAGTKTFALIVNDPDAPVGDWVHWILFDVPAGVAALPEGVPGDGALGEPAGARQGKNDFRRIGWGGPCPPPGSPHRYYFRLYALDTALALPAGATRSEVERAMKGHVLAQAETWGTYARRR